MRKIERVISGLRLERPIAALPKPLRFAIARRRYGWIDSLERLRHERDGDRSLAEVEAKNAIFVHIPKAAGVSVTMSLFGSHAASHTPLYMYLALYGSRRFDRMFKFAFVREPCDRLVSAFQFLKKGGLTDTDRTWAEANLAGFDDVEMFIRSGLRRPEILSWVHFRPQVWFLRDPRTGRPGVDFLGRFDRLSDDFATICAALRTTATLRHENRTGKTLVQLSPEAVAIVREVYRDDYHLLA